MHKKVHYLINDAAHYTDIDIEDLNKFCYPEHACYTKEGPLFVYKESTH